MTTKTKDFFVSYNKADKDWAVWVGWVLESAGYRVVLQDWDFRPGGNFVVQMDNASKGTRHTIAILSEDYLQSGFTKAEWANAFSKDPTGESRRLIPIRVKTCKPLGLLGTCIYEDLVGESENDAREKVVSILSDRRKPSGQPVFPGNITRNASSETKSFPGAESQSVDVWQEKVEFLRMQEAIVKAPNQKAEIAKKIRDAELKIGEIIANAIGPLSGKPGQVGQSFDIANEHALNSRLVHAIQRRDSLEAIGERTDDIEAEILTLKRQMRVGGILQRGDMLCNRYTLIEEVGNGGFATVWKSRDLRTKKVVAVKVLHPQSSKDPIKRERFFRGARVMSELNHDGVVNVLEPECHDDRFYFFVMEFIDGGNLHEAVLQKRITADQAVHVIVRILEILAYAHEHKNRYVHRDIKPTNVLIDKNGEAILTDFDLVAARNTTGGTQTGMLGTFDYAAPEQYTKPQEVDCRADIYSCARTGLFILAGQDLDPLKLIRNAEAVVEEQETSNELKAIFLKAIAWEREERFQSAAEFRKALLNPTKFPSKAVKKSPTRKRKTSEPTVRTRHGLPKLTSTKKVLKAMEEFDAKFRATGRHKNFESNKKNKYAIRHGGKLYPVKKIIELSTGRPVGTFTGGTGKPNELIRSLGFEVINMRDEATIPRPSDERLI